MSIVVPRGRQNQALQKKRQVRVFYCDAVHLSLSELVVYSYRAFQDEYDHAPHRKQVARAVGLSADTVSRADRELKRLGLLDGDLRARQPGADLFRRKQESDETRHWRHSLLSWTLFVRSSKCGLSPLSMAVWSYVVHCAETHWHPRGGLGASYLATILRANRAAVQKILGQLEKSGLLVRRDGCWCPVASKDYWWLADRWDGTTGKASRPSWQELPEGQEQVIPAPSYREIAAAVEYPPPSKCLENLILPINEISTPHLTLDYRKDIFRRIVATDAWQKEGDGYYDVYLELDRLLKSCKPGTEWDVLATWASTQIATPSTQIATPTDARRNIA